MKKSILLMLCAVIAIGASDALAQYGPKPEVVIGPGLNSGRTEYHQNWNKTLSADTVYVLTGLYFVDSTYTLTIPAGTVVKGDTAATLIVKRGAKIYARGKPLAPIVFTSRKAPNNRDHGDWGGVVILGSAPVNKVEPVIEGGIIGGSFGGTDPNDNSGVFAYCRIEFPGYRFQLNNEINGLTMGGVGRGTELHHVQVSYSFDDSYEWFGGTVDARNMVAFGGTDDEFDSDFGYSGRLQYLFGLRDPVKFDPNGESRGFESDNDENDLSTDEPYTSARASNATLIGPARTNAAIASIPPTATFDWSSVQRRSTKFSYINTAIIGYPRGISVRNDSTHAFACRGDLMIRCSSIAGFSQGNDTSRWPVGAPGCALGVNAWFATPSYNNIGPTRMPDTMGLTNMADLNDPNPIPLSTSELATAGTCTDYNDPWFEATSYRGAFDPAVTDMNQQWTAWWTNFSPKTTEYNPVNTGIGDDAPAVSTALLGQNRPNPFNPSTVISYAVPASGHITLKVYDVAGHEVATLVDGFSPAGTFDVTFRASGLSTG
ncbi:MAG: T9SS C-terminal target domain-containing protein, partial [bacterium]